MAYPTVDASYGFKAINELNGLPYAGAIRQIPIQRNYSTALFNGDLVKYEAGLVEITDMVETTASAPFGQIGVFVGCSYTSPSTGQKLFAQYYPGSIAANDITAFVVDDDRAVFKAVMIAQTGTISNTATTVGSASQAFVGTNVHQHRAGIARDNRRIFGCIFLPRGCRAASPERYECAPIRTAFHCASVPVPVKNR
jgi:hypothetical protein